MWVEAKSSLRRVDSTTLLISILGDTPKLAGAECVSEPDLWDVDADKEQHQIAIARCLECPVYAACLQWVDSLPEGHASGVIAGELRKPIYPLTRTRKAAQ